MYRYRMILLAFILSVTLLLGVMLKMTMARDTAVFHYSNAPVRNVALIGPADQVQQTAVSFLAAAQIRFLRDYPNVPAYLHEAPTTYSVTLSPDIVIQLFEFTMPDEEAMQVLAEIATVAQNHDVIVEDTNFAWLSFVPGSVLVSGPCAAIEQELNLFPGLGAPTVIDLSFSQDIGLCDENMQIHQYPIIDMESVLVRVGQINDVALTIMAQPNHFIVGTMSQDYIAGSPAGALAAPAHPWPITPFNQTGQDVRVLVFDSVPFTLTVGEVRQESYHGTPVTISYPFPLRPDLPLSGPSRAAHGSFVAGAVLDVAPEAQVHLVRVLNEAAIGDEFTFYQAAERAVSQTLAVSDTLAGLVMNYSFVLEISPTLSAPAMEAFLTAVSHRHVTQVGAAGNDSVVTPQPFPMLYPAKHDDVVGVTAVTWDTNAISCFANQGEVAIWGGGPARGSGCGAAAVISQCVNGSHPEYCVTGWDPHSTTGYAYGLGTSFSAPLVAGLAAQDIEAEAAVLGEWPTPALIRTRIYGRVTHNPAPASIAIGAIGTPYTIMFSTYLPFVTKN